MAIELRDEILQEKMSNSFIALTSAHKTNHFDGVRQIIDKVQ